MSSMKRKLVAGGVAIAAVAGGGGAIAATQLDSPSADSQAIINDAANQLGVQPSALSNALKKALENRVDAAVADGRLTKDQGDALKQRIESGDFPLLGGVPFGSGHFGHFAPFVALDTAASYLGLTEAQLRTQLNNGKTLAQVAQAQNKSVDGLVNALVDGATKKLDSAVSAGRLTKSQEQSILADLKTRVTSAVNSAQFRIHTDDGLPGFGGGFRHFRGGGPLPFGPTA
jgi:hypothetical protein